MRVALICTILLVQGCTILAKDKYFEVVSPDSLQRDTFHQIDCYMKHDLEICSTNIHAKSLAIGLLIPIIPSSKGGLLSYDIKRHPSITIENTSEFVQVLASLKIFEVCSAAIRKVQCSETSSVELAPEGKVILKIPDDDSIEFDISDPNGKRSLTIKPRFRYNIHAVSV